ncbi:putative pyridoxal phosphate-dependent aminotransferase EpsN [compost metagenome]
MSNICAGIGRGQLEALDSFVTKRSEIYSAYRSALGNSSFVTFMPIPLNSEPNYWLSVITLASQSIVTTNDIIGALEEANIESRPVWKPMHLQPIFQKYVFFAHNDDRVSERLFETGICLPSGSGMSKEQISDVVGIIRRILGLAKG